MSKTMESALCEERPAAATAKSPAKEPPRRFAYVGTGGRVKMFVDPVPTTYPEDAEIVGLCDLSQVRASFQARRLRDTFAYRDVPVYRADQFHQMLAETRPDQVVVCTMDRDHDQYIVESLRAGCDVVTEKPMTISAEKCRRILEAVEETGNSVRVAFNYRWAPGPTKVRQLLAEGVIGKICHVNMEYLLNTSHGADYFRRWHSQKECSGGLLVHKSTHHFDLINWWIDAIPEKVFAQGGLYFYGRENALRRGDETLTRYPRYYGQAPGDDPFGYDYSRSLLQDQEYERALYLGEAEKETGYVRDRNVFRDGITIEDVMMVQVKYRTGVMLNYSLNAFSPYEGYRVSFTGDRGRLEYMEWHGAHILGEDTTGAEHTHAGRHEITVYPHFERPYGVEIVRSEGGHGGGDPLLQEQIFSRKPPKDPFGRAAGHEQGAASIGVGIAANASMAASRPVSISEMLGLKPEAQRLSDLV